MPVVTITPVEAELEAPPPSILAPAPNGKPTKEGAELKEEEDKDAPEGKRGVSNVLAKLKNAQEMETRAWLDAIAGESPVRVSLLRKDPKEHRDPDTGEMVKTDGTLKVYDRAIDEEEVQRVHGGGTYQLSVKTKNTSGQWQYFAAKTFEIAGDPKTRDLRSAAPSKEPTIVIPQKDPTEGKILEKQFAFMADMVRDGNRQPQQSPGIDPATMQAMIRPLEIQITALTKQLADKDVEMARVREHAGKDPFRDKMLETMMDGESSRITALRTNHESEIRQLKEGFRQDLERERDRHQRDLERIDKQHEREVAAIKASNDQSIALSSQKADITKMVLDREVGTLEKQIARMDTELAALRAKKEMSIKEKVEELSAIKELVGDGDGEEASGWEKAIGAIGQLPIVAKLAERATGGAPAQQVPQAPPKNQIVRNKTTGEVSLRKPDGTELPLKRRPVAVTTGDGQQVEIPALDPEQVKQAVTFMEGAFRTGTDPVMFASSARPYVSESMLGVIRTLGISEFLIKVGRIDGTSVLSTLRGRQWAKKVAAALMGEEDAPAPAAPVADPALATEPAAE